MRVQTQHSYTWLINAEITLQAFVHDDQLAYDRFTGDIFGDITYRYVLGHQCHPEIAGAKHHNDIINAKYIFKIRSMTTESEFGRLYIFFMDGCCYKPLDLFLL